MNLEQQIKYDKQYKQNQTLENMTPLFITLLIVFIALLFSLPTQTLSYQKEQAVNEYILADTTAYSEIDSCHYENCAMATGVRAYIGAVACPRDMPLQTKVMIDDKVYVCEDRYNKNLSDRFDIFMGYGKEAFNEAKNYGKQRKAVQILR